jgi:hypothetical protein
MVYFYLLIGQALNSFAPLALAPIIIATAGLNEWGKFSLFLLATTFVSAFYTGKIQSMHSDAVRISKKKYLKNQSSQILTGITVKLLKKNLIILSILLMAYLISNKIENTEKVSILTLGLANGVCQSIIASYRLSHLVAEDYITFTKYAIVFFILKISTVFIALNINQDIQYCILLYLMVNIVEILIRTLLMERIDYSKITSVVSSRSLRLMMPLLFYSLSTIVDRIIIERMMNLTEFGLYNLLMMLIGASVFAFSPLNQKLLMADDLTTKLKNYTINIIKLYIITAFVVYIIINNSHTIIETIKIENIKLIIIIAIVSFFQIITGLNMVRHQVDQNIQFYWRLGIIGFLINIIIMPTLVHFYSIEGAIWGMLICSVVIFLYVSKNSIRQH